MISLSAPKPLDRWAYDRIQPGGVGSVGDVNMQVKLKSSLPGDLRWDPQWQGKREVRLGANVADGMYTSYSNGGGPARTRTNFLGGNRDTRTSHGWKFENLKPEDRADEPVMGELPQLSWRMNVANVKDRLRTGNLFANRPGGLVNAPTGVPRGGNVPQIIATEAGLAPLGNFTGAREQALAFGSGQQFRTTNTNDLGVGSGSGGKRLIGSGALGRIRG